MSNVTIIIPCYNYGRFLRECVESVLSQEGVEVRVLIIDDASSDDTEAVGRGLTYEDDRVSYRRHAANRGHIETYNEGLDWANGDYTVLLSADDMLTPGSLFRAVALMEARPEVGLTYGQAIWTEKPGLEELEVRADATWTAITGQEFLETSCKLATNLVPTATAVVRTALQHEIGGYKKELPHTGDLEMWLRFASHSSVGFVHAYQAFCRVHQSNMSKNFVGIADFLHRKQAFDAVFATPVGQVILQSHLRRVLTRAMSEEAFWSAYDAFENADMPRSKEWMSLASRFDRGLRFHRKWWQLRLMWLLGPQLALFLLGGFRKFRTFLSRPENAIQARPSSNPPFSTVHTPPASRSCRALLSQEPSLLQHD